MKTFENSKGLKRPEEYTKAEIIALIEEQLYEDGSLSLRPKLTEILLLWIKKAQ